MAAADTVVAHQHHQLGIAASEQNAWTAARDHFKAALTASNGEPHPFTFAMQGIMRAEHAFTYAGQAVTEEQPMAYIHNRATTEPGQFFRQARSGIEGAERSLMQVLNRRHAELSADDLQQVRHWRARASRFAGRTALAEVVAMGYTMDAALYEGKLAKAWLAHDRAHDILINTPTSKLPIGPELMHNAIDGARVTAMMPRSAARLARAILWQYRIRQAVRWTNKHDPVHRQEVRAIKQARRHEAKSREHVVDSVRKHV